MSLLKTQLCVIILWCYFCHWFGTTYLDWDTYWWFVQVLYLVEYLVSFYIPDDTGDTKVKHQQLVFKLVVSIFTGCCSWFRALLVLALPNVVKSGPGELVFSLYMCFYKDKIPLVMVEKMKQCYLLEISRRPIPRMSDTNRANYSQFGLCRFPTKISGTIYFLQLAVPIEGSMNFDEKNKLAGEVGEWVMLFPEMCLGWKYTDSQKESIKLILQKYFPNVLGDLVVEHLPS